MQIKRAMNGIGCGSLSYQLAGKTDDFFCPPCNSKFDRVKGNLVTCPKCRQEYKINGKFFKPTEVMFLECYMDKRIKGHINIPPKYDRAVMRLKCVYCNVLFFVFNDEKTARCGCCNTEYNVVVNK